MKDFPACGPLSFTPYLKKGVPERDGDGQLPFTVNTHSASAGLGAGTYTGSVTFVITTSDGVSAQVTVGVTLSVSSPLT